MVTISKIAKYVGHGGKQREFCRLILYMAVF